LLFGQHDHHLRVVESQFPVQLVARGDEITVRGLERDVQRVVHLFADLIERLEIEGEISQQYLQYAIDMIKANGKGPGSDLPAKGLIATRRRGMIRAKTVGQARYLEAISDSDIVFVIGPAGTGKTYLAVAAALAELKRHSVERIILVRPAVEAGESLGFLPGDLRAKVDPYLRPVYDALNDMLPADRIQHYLELGTIEIVPLAFMRGRTLSSAFVILDEAQNSTRAQMKMFLTRLGVNSRSVITGDVTQIDLVSREQSGLLQAERVLSGVAGIRFCYLTHKDVVRHRLVQQIVKAYDRFENHPTSDHRDE
jgi:phosphate starvation-inducible PhoH-like protein